MWYAYSPRKLQSPELCLLGMGEIEARILSVWETFITRVFKFKIFPFVFILLMFSYKKWCMFIKENLGNTEEYRR